VGSRDLTLDHQFCSRVCCGYALRMGKAIRHRWPEVDPYVFYMDLQNFGKDFIPAYEEAKEHLTLIRGIPGSVGPATGDRIALGYQPEGGGPPREEVFDLVVLSVGLMPSAENEQWAQRFQLPRTEDGFLKDHAEEGIFTVGTVTGPMDIAQSAADGGRAARAVADYLGVRGYLC
jgi:heterodisulfide reductase subunit A2